MMNREPAVLHTNKFYTNFLVNKIAFVPTLAQINKRHDKKSLMASQRLDLQCIIAVLRPGVLSVKVLRLGQSVRLDLPSLPRRSQWNEEHGSPLFLL